MKNNIDYYKHQVTSHNHWKFKALRRKYGWEGEGRFWALNNMIGDSADCILDTTDEDRMLAAAADLDMELVDLEEFIKYLIDKCKLILPTENGITTKRTLETLNGVTEKRERMRERYKQKVENSDSRKTVSDGRKSNSVSRKRNSDSRNKQSTVQHSTVENSTVQYSNNNGADAPAYTEEQQATFAYFQQWIDKNAPRVAKMKEPFSIEQYYKLKEDGFTKAQVQEIILKMHNYEPLLKKNRSANLTLRNWSKKEFNSPGAGSTNNQNQTDDELRQREKDEQRTRELSQQD